MKSIKRMFAFMLSAAMVLMMAIPAFAAGTGTITIDNAIAGNTYTVYKVFDADGNGTSISYKVMESKKDVVLPTGFVTDAAGNVIHGTKGDDGKVTPSKATELTADEIAAIAAYVKGDTAVAEAKTADSTTVTFSGLANGYYYITTTTGTAVTITSTNPSITVKEKNEAPTVDKDITSVDYGSFDESGKAALAEVGATVGYTATVSVKAGAKNYVFKDKMGSGLSYNSNSLKVKVDGSEIDASVENAETYTVSSDTNSDIIITFADTWIANQVGKNVVITYTATITDSALTVEAGKNTASISYGDNNVTVSLDPDDVPVVRNATITVTKIDGTTRNALAGAGFVLKNTDGKYYKETKTGGVVTDIEWVTSIEDATELKTVVVGTGNNAVAQIEFVGLANGTYTLIEKTTPAGYNTAADQNFTIVSGNYESTNLAQATTVENNTGSTLPSTGGTGTTVLYTIGIVLVLGAGILLVVRRRMSVER